jgi:hypothetical protein
MRRVLIIAAVALAICLHFVTAQDARPILFNATKFDVFRVHFNSADIRIFWRKPERCINGRARLFRRYQKRFATISELILTHSKECLAASRDRQICE